MGAFTLHLDDVRIAAIKSKKEDKNKKSEGAKYPVDRHFVQGCLDGLNYASLWIICVLKIWFPDPITKLPLTDEL